MPENLAPEPSIKPLLDETNRKRKKLPAKSNQDDRITGIKPHDTLCE
jgi:hypothetical protein